jgi:hypothetical protein
VQRTGDTLRSNPVPNLAFIENHAARLLAAGFPEHRVQRFVEVAESQGLRRGFRALNKVTCDARTKRDGRPCFAAPVPGNTRCKFHGGMSTGPKTPEGRARIAEAQRRRWAKYREFKEVFG